MSNLTPPPDIRGLLSKAFKTPGSAVFFSLFTPHTLDILILLLTLYMDF
jgi:hypothetical protein